MQLITLDKDNLLGHEFWLVVVLYKTSDATEARQWLFATKEEARDYYYSLIPSGDRFERSEAIKRNVEGKGMRREDYYEEDRYDYYTFIYGETEVKAAIFYRPIRVEKEDADSRMVRDEEVPTE